MKHITVLLKEAVDSLGLKPDAVVVDATLGAGGHTEEIIANLRRKGIYIGIDADPTAITDFTQSRKAGQNSPLMHLVNDNFANLENILSSLHIKEVDAILADLGWRTDQFTDSGKGFSFAQVEPLSMTYGDPANYTFTAHEVVNEWEEENLSDVIYAYGEERYSRRIAKAICERRKVRSINDTKDLVSIILSAVPAHYRQGKIHGATRTFQALRIVVNDELGKLEKFISAALPLLTSGGRLAIISFHSLEDRIVKLRFREMVKTGNFKLVNKKPIVATDEELKINPRARSAKLRIIEKVSKHEYPYDTT